MANKQEKLLLKNEENVQPRKDHTTMNKLKAYPSLSSKERSKFGK